KDGGIYCKIGGKTSLELTREAAAGAAAVIALGSCASWGGMPSTPPNPTGSVGVAEALGRNDILSIPGCPSNPYNFLATVVHFLTFGKLPPIDKKGRPLFAYSRLIHENCERRAHFDAGRFALLFGDVGMASWPVGTGHPCIGCSEQGIGFAKPIHALADLKNQRPPVSYPRVAEEQGTGLNTAGVAVLSGVVGAAVGAGAMLTKKLGALEGGGQKSGETRQE